jgi:cyclophilin family peptidyl-prolyl cis-trans isomerase/HEAT repeat protein
MIGRHTGLVVLLVALAGCAAPDPIPRIEDERDPASETLIAALGDPSPERRARAALAMGRIQSAAYLEPLVAAARGDDRSVRLAALFALGQLGLAQGAAVPSEAVKECIGHLDDPDSDIVVRAVEALGKLADPRVPEAIVPLLEHADPDVRAEVATALFRCRFAPVWRGEAAEPPALPGVAVEALIEAMDDEDASVRRAVVYAFSRYGQPEAIKRLAATIADDDEWIRLFAVRGIGRSGKAKAGGVLTAALDDASDHVRSEAIAALAALELVERIPASLASDPSFHVRAALARALAADESVASLEALGALEGDPSATVRTAAIEALASRLRGGYRDRLESHLVHDDWRIRAAAARGAGHLAEEGMPLVGVAAGESDTRVRTAALAAVERIGGGERYVLEALEADDLALRGTAVTLLAKRKHPRKLEAFAEAYDRSTGVEWIEVREAIADAVADLDGAEPLLRRMLQDDPAPSVRAKARDGLAGLGVLLPGEPETTVEVSPLLGIRFEDDPVVTLVTSKGEIRIRCLARDAPIHVASFVDLVRAGYYDGLTWHRVVTNFVIQGGDPRGDGWGGAGYTLRDEINTSRYGRGAVGMPKAGKDTGGGQIFITHVPTPHLDGNYTVFGQVVDGLEVVDRIEVGDTIVGARVD